MEKCNPLPDASQENFQFDLSNVSMTNINEEEIDFPSFCERSDVNLLAKSMLVQTSVNGLK